MQSGPERLVTQQEEKPRRRQGPPAPKPRILVLASGGTIASVVDADTGAATPALTASELLNMLPELDETMDVTVCEYGLEASADLRFEDATAMNRKLADAFGSGMDGAVVTQGTDTMEEVAFALDLLHGETARLC